MSKNSKIKPCQWTTKNKQILSLSVLLTGSGLNWGVRDRFSALIKLKQLSHCLDHSLIRFLGRGGWGTWFTQSEDPNMQKVTFFSSRFAFTILHMYIDQLEVTWRSNWPTLLLLCCQPGKHLRDRLRRQLSLTQMQSGFKFVKSFDEGVERVVNGTFAFLNSEGALRWVQIVWASGASIKLGLGKMTTIGSSTFCFICDLDAEQVPNRCQVHRPGWGEQLAYC